MYFSASADSGVNVCGQRSQRGDLKHTQLREKQREGEEGGQYTPAVNVISQIVFQHHFSHVSLAILAVKRASAQHLSGKREQNRDRGFASTLRAILRT